MESEPQAAAPEPAVVAAETAVLADAPAALAALPVRTAARAADALRAAGAPPLDPPAVLALQRTAGNLAVSRLLGRQEKERTPAGGPGDFGSSGGEPKSSGTTTVAKMGADKVEIVSPDVTFDAEVWLKEDKKLEGSAYLGWVQNLAASNRGAVYRRGGDPAGEIVGEDYEGRSKRWDAVNDPKAENEEGKMVPHKGVFPPFYWPPGTITDDNLGQKGAAKTPAGAHDQPRYNMPVMRGPAGRITEFKGRDQFKLGLAVKKDAAIHMLKAFDWSVDWAAQVSADLSGAGKAVESKEVQDALKDGPDVSLTDWSLKPGSGSIFEGFATPAEAMKREPGDLLKWIFAAKEHDPLSYQNICAALDAKAPALAVNIHCDTTHANFTDDVLSASVFRDGSLVKTHGGIRLNNNKDHPMRLGFAEVFGSASALTHSTSIKVELSVGAEGLPAEGAVKFPFKDALHMEPGDGKYDVTFAFG